MLQFMRTFVTAKLTAMLSLVSTMPFSNQWMKYSPGIDWMCASRKWANRWKNSCNDWKRWAPSNFRAVTAAQNQEAAIRGAFIAGLSSGYIRHRLLEDAALELQAVFDKARSLDDAQRNVEIYSSRSPGTLAACEPSSETEMRSELECLAVKRLQCFFCGRKRHARRLPCEDLHLLRMR